MSGEGTGPLPRLDQARETVAVAERELALALEKLAVLDRAEKTMISELLRAALDKVAAAREALDAIGEGDGN